MKRYNRSHFKIKSLNQEKLFNKICKQFELYNIKQQENFVQFEVDETDADKVEKYLLESNITIEQVKHNGWKRKCKNFFKKWGIIAGILCGIIFYCLQYSFVFRIDVWGCQNIGQQEIVKFVNDQLISNFKPNIDTEKLELELKDNFEQISSVSVAIIGQSLVVNINEAVLPEEMQGSFQPIVSDYDGMITHINLIQGTPNVKVGDIVQKGDVLVYPYVADGEGQVMPVLPRAEIKADVWLSENEVFYEYQIKQERTGRKIECGTITLFGLEIYSNLSDNTFENYESEKTSFYLTQNNILPFIYSKITFYETKTIEIIRNFEEEKVELFEKLRQKALISVAENEIIKDEMVSVKQGGGVYYINLILTVEKDIGEGYGYIFPQS